MRRLPVAGTAVLVVLGLILAAAPLAAAHCAVDGNIAVVPRCFIQEVMEIPLDALNGLADGDFAVVLVKDFRFHPENVTINNGGTVFFVWADHLNPNNHDPRNSLSTGDQLRDMMKPPPGNLTLVGRCFDILADTHGAQGETTDLYHLTFLYDAARPGIQKSFGAFTGSVPVLGAIPGSEEFRDCLPDVASYSPDPTKAVLPYHCGFHGVPGGTNGQTQMRGTITIRT